MTNINDWKRARLDEEQARKMREYEAASEQRDTVIDAVAQEKAAQQAEAAWRRIDEIQQELDALVRTPDSSPQHPSYDLNRIETQLKGNLHKIDFRKLQRLIDKIADGDSERGRAGLLLFQRSTEYNGRMCAARVREALRQKTGTERLRSIEVEFRSGDRNDTGALLRHLATEVGLDLEDRPEAECIDLVAATLCGMLEQGGILLIEVRRCEYLLHHQPQAVRWLVEAFWRPLLQRLAQAAGDLYGDITLILLLFVDESLPATALPSDCCCSPRRIRADRLLPVKPAKWTRDDLRQWIARYGVPVGCSRELVGEIADAIDHATGGGLPGLAENALLDRLLALYPADSRP